MTSDDTVSETQAYNNVAIATAQKLHELRAANQANTESKAIVTRLLQQHGRPEYSSVSSGRLALSPSGTIERLNIPQPAIITPTTGYCVV